MKKILIVEDELLIAFFLQKKLHETEYEIVDMAYDGEMAIESARLHMPDVILMDIRLRGAWDGIETMEQIRRFSDVPVVFFTAFLDPYNAERVRRTENALCLIKPITLEQLRESIGLLLTSSV